MAEKSPRRRMLEESLAADPTDSFLRYGLAVQCLRDGDTQEGRDRLRELIAEAPKEVAACQQLGQSYLESGETTEAVAALREGIARARATGNAHAAAEMQGMLESLPLNGSRPSRSAGLTVPMSPGPRRDRQQRDAARDPYVPQSDPPG